MRKIKIFLFLCLLFNSCKNSEEKSNSKYTVLDKTIEHMTYNLNNCGQKVIINKQLLPIPIKNHYYLLLYFNNTTCNTCLDNAMLDYKDIEDSLTMPLIIITNGFSKKELQFFANSIKCARIELNTNLTINQKEAYSPSFLLIDNELNITHSWAYINELPIQNMAFLKSLVRFQKLNHPRSRSSINHIHCPPLARFCKACVT